MGNITKNIRHHLMNVINAIYNDIYPIFLLVSCWWKECKKDKHYPLCRPFSNDAAAKFGSEINHRSSNTHLIVINIHYAIKWHGMFIVIRTYVLSSPYLIIKSHRIIICIVYIYDSEHVIWLVLWWSCNLWYDQCTVQPFFRLENMILKQTKHEI